MSFFFWSYNGLHSGFIAPTTTEKIILKTSVIFRKKKRLWNIIPYELMKTLQFKMTGRQLNKCLEIFERKQIHYEWLSSYTRDLWENVGWILESQSFSLFTEKIMFDCRRTANTCFSICVFGAMSFAIDGKTDTLVPLCWLISISSIKSRKLFWQGTR